MAEKPPWFTYLESARELARKKSEFTAKDFADAAGIEGTGASAPNQIATAWLSKFVRWKYVEIVGKEKGDGIRPSNVYSITDTGLKCELTLGPSSKLDRLLAAVRGFREALGTPREAAARKLLFKEADEVSA